MSQRFPNQHGTQSRVALAAAVAGGLAAAGIVVNKYLRNKAGQSSKARNPKGVDRSVLAARTNAEVSSAATSPRRTQQHQKQTDVNIVDTGLMGGHNRDLILATRTGQTRQVQQILLSRPNDLNRVSREDATTLVYHAAFCGHLELLQWLLEEGGQADWPRTYMASCPSIRDILKPYTIHGNKKRAAIHVIKRHMGVHVHNWLWKPITRDGKPGIFARLLVKDMISNQADGFQQWT